MKGHAGGRRDGFGGEFDVVVGGELRFDVLVLGMLIPWSGLKGWGGWCWYLIGVFL